MSNLHTHEFREVARQKGRRVRYGCATCPKLGPWIRVIQPEAVDSFVEEGGNAGITSKHPPAGYDKMTVTDLRHLAKTRGHHGYSKMKKDELVTLLQG